MMEDKEYESSDADDSDFKPDGLSDDSAPSECDSEENEDDNDDQESEQSKKKKSKKGQKKKTTKSRRKRKKTSASTDEEDESIASKSDNEDNRTKLNPEEEKARADSLWKSFLSDTGTPSKAQSSTSKTTTPTSSSKVSQDSNTITDKQQTANSDKTDEKTISLTTESTSENSDNKIAPIATVAIQKPSPASSTRSSPSENGDKQSPLQNNSLKKRGLSSFLSNINKKSKLSTLEKSKLDWNQFKQENDLTEEINNFNRGKNGYLERQDFLQRTDLKQFEIEKDLRNVGKRKLR